MLFEVQRTDSSNGWCSPKRSCNNTHRSSLILVYPHLLLNLTPLYHPLNKICIRILLSNRGLFHFFKNWLGTSSIFVLVDALDVMSPNLCSCNEASKGCPFPWVCNWGSLWWNNPVRYPLTWTNLIQLTGYTLIGLTKVTILLLYTSFHTLILSRKILCQLHAVVFPNITICAWFRGYSVLSCAFQTRNHWRQQS